MLYSVDNTVFRSLAIAIKRADEVDEEILDAFSGEVLYVPWESDWGEARARQLVRENIRQPFPLSPKNYRYQARDVWREHFHRAFPMERW